MNKLVKGSIAGAAGIALLLGGAGTLATWNSSAAVTSAATGITAGTLEITPVAGDAGVWKSGTKVIDISKFKIVPGDTLTYTKTFDVTAVGDNLTATAALGTSAITAASAGATGGALAQDTALANALTKSATFSVNNSNSPVVTATTNTKQIVVTVSITYTKATALLADGTGAENSSKLGSVNLAAFAVTLTQN